MRKYFLNILIVITFASFEVVKAQTSGGNSPYSRYGWGKLTEEAQGFNKGMAGAGIAARGKEMLNYQNPASYSALDSITFLFDAGISLQNGHWSENGKSINALNSSLDYLQAGFRLRKHLGISIGVRPISIVAYDFYATKSMPDNDGFGVYTSTSSYSGEGGVRKIWLGLGWEPVKNLSVGINGGYIWGDYSHKTSITYSNANVHSLAREYKGSINTYDLNLGVQYTQELSKKDILTVGATFGLGHDINSRSTYINQKLTTTSVLGGDTMVARKEYQIPMSLRVGATLKHNDKWTFAADYTCQLWKDCKFPELVSTSSATTYSAEKNTFRNLHKIALGTEYIPNPEGLKLRHHVAYRAGVSYATSYVNVNNDGVVSSGPKSLIVSAGLGLPIVNMYNNRSMLNASVQWEHLIPGRSHSLKEDYLRLCIGLSFNANWFNKWKIE